MNYRMIFYMVGQMLKAEGLLLLLPLFVAFAYGEYDTMHAFFFTIVACMALGFLCGWKPPKNKSIFSREGFITVALCWIVMSLLGSLPFYLTGYIPSFVDCFFETVSGFTTTGASILTDVECLTHGLLFWRSFTHWIGGIGVLVFILAILPQSDARSIYIMRAEVPGPTMGKLVSRTKHTARILYTIYIVLTMVEILLLVGGRMPLFDSLTHAFGTAGTGGFSIKNTSIAYYDNSYFEAVIGIFMVIFGINFNLFYLLLIGNLSQALKSEELRWYLGIIFGSILLIGINLLPVYQHTERAFRDAAFQVASIITTTGYATADYNQWPLFSQFILILLMFFGACAGSTGGGIKTSRLIILAKTTLREINRALHPHSVNALKFEGRPVDEQTVTGVNSFFVIYMITMGGSMLLLCADSYDFATVFGGVVSCINNIGPGLNHVGPTGNYSGFSDLSKLVLSFDMLAGRLEFFPILLLFAPSTWKNVRTK